MLASLGMLLCQVCFAGLAYKLLCLNFYLAVCSIRYCLRIVQQQDVFSCDNILKLSSYTAGRTASTAGFIGALHLGGSAVSSECGW